MRKCFRPSSILQPNLGDQIDRLQYMLNPRRIASHPPDELIGFRRRD
jgi:hypothetical protein